jgi:DNA-directed RNA polymerase specialized sigma24 family protein
VIARNAALAIVRREMRMRERVIADLSEYRAPQVEDDAPPMSAATSGFIAALRSCIGKLPKMQRSVIEADLQTGEVAEADVLAERLNTTKNSIYVSRSVARKSLKRCLAGQGHDLGDPASKTDMKGHAP